jgi:hypothetical protein
VITERFGRQPEQQFPALADQALLELNSEAGDAQGEVLYRRPRLAEYFEET